MAVIQDGSGASLAAVGANLALRVQPGPLNGGCYAVGFETTSLAFTSNTVVFDFRNPSAQLAVVTQIKARIISMAIATPAATGLRQSLQLFLGRNYTVQSTTGATALSMAGNNGKLRTSFGASSCQLGFANVTGGITGGTITEDTITLAVAGKFPQSHSVTAAAAPGAGIQDSNDYELEWSPNDFGCPIILAQNEGFRLRYLVTTAAAVIINGSVKWSEVSAYP